MTRSVVVATLTKIITSCQIKNYIAVRMNKWINLLSATLDCRTCPARDDTINVAMDSAELD